MKEHEITMAVGQFIRSLRNGKYVSLQKLLKENGVNSSTRAKQLMDRMFANGIICKHSDGKIYLTRENYVSKEIMPILLKREYHRRITVSIENPLEKFSSKQLVEELRNRGYEVKATKLVEESL
jgi:hypothetical protein